LNIIESFLHQITDGTVNLAKSREAKARIEYCTTGKKIQPLAGLLAALVGCSEEIKLK
jgi:hypothetical protein